ncbi:MAG: preprotein translocase subunit SecE [Clostridia bacterium]|jgi:preprotein translocase SecE subunit|nr:preprotein translocase subunit SecE [Clostridia bacterium]
MSGFLKDFKKEVSKVIWPSFDSIVKSTRIVIEFVAILVIFIALSDFILRQFSLNLFRIFG